MDAKLHKKLSDRQEKGTMRSLSSFEGYTDFFSNDYLGLASKAATVVNMSGSSGSRLLSGNSVDHENIERQFASFYDVPAVLHFNSGYDANLGIFSSIPQKGDTILYDALIHASARDGIRLSWAKSFPFYHNDLEHLEKRLQKAEGAVYVAVESLYSMDGDIAPLKGISALCDQYGAYLIVDEAHSGGIFGEKGKGLVEELEISHSVFMRIITFGKAYGSHGAVVLCDLELRNYLVNFCRPFIYSTALPVAVLQHNLVQVRTVSDELLFELRSVIDYYSSEMKFYSAISSPKSPIQIIEIGDVAKTREIANELQAAKIAVKPIYSPTIPEGKERLRICLHAFNTQGEIDRLVGILKKALQ